MTYDLSPEGQRHLILKKKVELYGVLFSANRNVTSENDLRIMALIFDDPEVQKALAPDPNETTTIMGGVSFQ